MQLSHKRQMSAFFAIAGRQAEGARGLGSACTPRVAWPCLDAAEHRDHGDLYGVLRSINYTGMLGGPLSLQCTHRSIPEHCSLKLINSCILPVKPCPSTCKEYSTKMLRALGPAWCMQATLSPLRHLVWEHMYMYGVPGAWQDARPPAPTGGTCTGTYVYAVHA